MKALLSIGLLFATAAAFAMDNTTDNTDVTGGAFDATVGATTGLGATMDDATRTTDVTGGAFDATVGAKTGLGATMNDMTGTYGQAFMNNKVRKNTVRNNGQGDQDFVETQDFAAAGDATGATDTTY